MNVLRDVPPMLTLPVTQPPVLPRNMTEKVIPPITPMLKDEYVDYELFSKENHFESILHCRIEPLPFPQRGLGPIQRPTKLPCPPTQSSMPSFMKNPMQSPETPDVIDQLNHLLNHQNSVQTGAPSTPLTTPNIPWTPFLPAECVPKYDPTWPMANMQTPPVLLTAPTQNPFALISTMNEQGQQSPREEIPVWSTALGTATPRVMTSGIRSQRGTTWNDFLQPKVPSSTDLTRVPNGSMLKYWSAPDPTSADRIPVNGHMTGAPNPVRLNILFSSKTSNECLIWFFFQFWDLNTLPNEPVAPPSMINVQVPAASWWSNSSSDQNNNKNQGNRLDNDPSNNRDHSRWEFAR